jgi:hypothetical protein
LEPYSPSNSTESIPTYAREALWVSFRCNIVRTIATMDVDRANPAKKSETLKLAIMPHYTLAGGPITTTVRVARSSRLHRDERGTSAPYAATPAGGPGLTQTTKAGAPHLDSEMWVRRILMDG